MDVAYNTTTMVARLGAIARDKKARIGFSTITKAEGIEPSLQAETLVILFGLQMASEMKYQNLQVESVICLSNDANMTNQLS